MGGVVNIVGLKVGQVYNSSAGEKERNELSNKTDPNDLAPAISESEHPRLNPKVPSFLKYVASNFCHFSAVFSLTWISRDVLAPSPQLM